MLVYAMKAYGGSRGIALPILNLGRLNPPPYPLNRRLGGPRSRSGRFEKENNVLFLLGIELRIVQYIDQPLYRLSYPDFQQETIDSNP